MKSESHQLVAKAAHETLSRELGVKLDLKKLQKGSTIPDFHLFWRCFSHRKEHLLLDVLYQINHVSKLIRQKAPISYISYKLGIISHFLSDFFTAAHNFYTKSELPRHIRYEKELGDYIAKHVPNICQSCISYKNSYTAKTFDVAKYLEDLHAEYSRQEQSFETDMNYALDAFTTVLLFLFDPEIRLKCPYRELFGDEQEIVLGCESLQKHYIGRSVIRRYQKKRSQLNRYLLRRAGSRQIIRELRPAKG